MMEEPFMTMRGYFMRAYGSHNALEHSINDEMKYEEKEFDIVTYQTAKNNWYILSGYKDDNIIFINGIM